MHVERAGVEVPPSWRVSALTGGSRPASARGRTRPSRAASRSTCSVSTPSKRTTPSSRLVALGTGRNRQPVLRVERVLVGALEVHLRPPDPAARRGCGPGWRNGRNPSTPVRVAGELTHFIPLCNTPSHIRPHRPQGARPVSAPRAENRECPSNDSTRARDLPAAPGTLPCRRAARRAGRRAHISACDLSARCALAPGVARTARP